MKSVTSRDLARGRAEAREADPEKSRAGRPLTAEDVLNLRGRRTEGKGSSACLKGHGQAAGLVVRVLGRWRVSGDRHVTQGAPSTL